MPIKVRFRSDFVQESPYFQVRVSECETEPNRGSVNNGLRILLASVITRQRHNPQADRHPSQKNYQAAIL
jgi:hypothetical protein